MAETGGHSEFGLESEGKVWMNPEYSVLSWSVSLCGCEYNDKKYHKWSWGGGLPWKPWGGNNELGPGCGWFKVTVWQWGLLIGSGDERWEDTFPAWERDGWSHEEEWVHLREDREEPSLGAWLQLGLKTGIRLSRQLATHENHGWMSRRP